jgi:hypothetical protein
MTIWDSAALIAGCALALGEMGPFRGPAGGTDSKLTGPLASQSERVLIGMLSPTYQFQILWPIIQGIAIAMVHLFPGFEGPAEDMGHNMSMLKFPTGRAGADFEQDVALVAISGNDSLPQRSVSSPGFPTFGICQLEALRKSLQGPFGSYVRASALHSLPNLQHHYSL